MQKGLAEFDNGKTKIVAVSYDSVEILKQFSDKNKLTFPLLSDSKSEVIKSFDQLNKSAKGRQAGIPHPATYLVDQKGIIQSRLDGTIFRRHSNEALAKAIKELKAN